MSFVYSEFYDSLDKIAFSFFCSCFWFYGFEFIIYAPE